MVILKMNDVVKSVLDLHKPVMRMVPDGEVETCGSCSQVATMECVEYVHLVEFPCPTVTLIYKESKVDGELMSRHEMGVMIVRLLNRVQALEELINDIESRNEEN